MSLMVEQIRAQVLPESKALHDEHSDYMQRLPQYLKSILPACADPERQKKE